MRRTGSPILTALRKITPTAISLARMPLPNDYTIGDGLNTAGIRWTRHSSYANPSMTQNFDQNRNQVNFRIDHNFSSKHKLSVVYTYERDYGLTTEAGIAPWPGG